jgi:ferredoxin-NADP reductase/Na+-translocating ferredoxin:NAD+ oxidoreductase RnfD subunit
MFGLMPYSPLAILYLTVVLLGVSLVTNYVFARVFEAPTNFESVYITALILALIIKPTLSLHSLPFWFLAAALSMATKYIFAIGRKHMFNPAAIAVVMTSFGIMQGATWWVGTTLMAPFVLLTGILIVRKIRRLDLVLAFFFTAFLTSIGFTILGHSDPLTTISTLTLHSSLLFFAFIMLTEPLTTPSTKTLQAVYGGLVGVLFAPQVHIGSVYSTPELALVVGNIFSYLISPKQKFFLYLKEKVQAGTGIIDFVFQPKQKLSFTPGQYMEWTLPLKHIDSRGNRRYFTIASSPTESELRLGVKFVDKGSSYKRTMQTMTGDQVIVGGQLSGDFVLPKDKTKKLVFVAGGIGVTPYRSMLKYLIDTNEKRDIVLFYSNPTVDEIVYSDVFDAAEQKLGIRTIYTLTDKEKVPANWLGNVGRLSVDIVKKEIPDYISRTFYLSGPFTMVTGCESVLKGLGIPPQQIKKDFFPGLV